MTTSAPAPAAVAASRKRCPSVRSPGQREEGLAARDTSRESTAPPAIGRVPPGDQLAVGPASPARRGSGHVGSGPRPIGADGDRAASARRSPSARARPLCHRGHSRTRLSASMSSERRSRALRRGRPARPHGGAAPCRHVGRRAPAAIAVACRVRPVARWCRWSWNRARRQQAVGRAQRDRDSRRRVLRLRDAELPDRHLRDPAEELIGRDVELELALSRDLRPGLAEADRDDELGLVAADEAHEAEVEARALYLPFSLSQIWAVPGLAADLVAAG